MAKPFQKEEVLARVRTQLERARLLRELAAKNTALEEHSRELTEKNRALEEEMARRQRLTSERDDLADRLSHLSQLEIERHGVAGFVGQSRAVQVVLEEIALLQQAHWELGSNGQLHHWVSRCGCWWRRCRR